VSLADRLARKRLLQTVPSAAGRAAPEPGDEPDEGNYGETIEHMGSARRKSVQHSPGSPTRCLARPEPESDQDADRAAAIKQLARRGANHYAYLKR
jgi:hypothetical protein